MILDDVITDVRRIIQDETATFRYSDAFMLAMGNQALKRIQLLRPDLFAKTGTMTCVEDQVLQSAPDDSLRIIEVLSINGTGVGLVEANRETLDQTLPTWPNDTAAAAINWMRHVRNPNKFFIYPQAPAAQTLDIEYSQVPTTYDGSTTITLLPDAFFPVVVDVMVFLLESVDNESVTTGRAKLYKESYIEMLGVNKGSTPLTDTEDAGLDLLKVEVV
jgi:hypothetical protein|tara:strand:- start:1297 stop:1950 length:654 start_codon:yes stop_codon:yes gene_type:complete